MSVDDSDQIDIVTRREDGTVCLVVTDHLPWGDPEHLHALQEKLNTYIAFVETGQVRELDAVSEEDRVIVQVLAKYTPDADGEAFLFAAGEVMAGAGIALEWREAEA